jgi:hypothetical protein
MCVDIYVRHRPIAALEIFFGDRLAFVFPVPEEVMDGA